VHASTGSLRTRSFGVFEVDLRAAELRKFGIKIKLLEQPFQLLALLIPHPGELVTRDEIRQARWPEHTFVDFGRASHRALKVLLAEAATALHIAHEQAPGHRPNQDRNRGVPRSTRA
jgi:DNA-binding response OmpR family regulator